MAVQTDNFPLVRTVTNLVRNMLADEPVAPGYPFVPLSIQAAAGGIVTATFQTPPGFIAGDSILVSGISPSSHNGTFVLGLSSGPQIAWQNSGPPPGLATIGSGTIQGYGTGKKYTDPILMAFVNSAYRGLQRALKATGSTEFRQDQAFVTIPGLTFADASTQVSLGFMGLSITSDANPAPQFDIAVPLGILPDDLLMPRKIWERPTGTSQTFREVTDLTNEGGIPSIAQGTILERFAWLGDSIDFIGAIQDTDIRIEYDKSLQPVSDGSAQLMVLNSEDYHAFSVASMVSKSRGGKEVQEWDQAAEDSKERLINAVTRGQQFKSFRTKAFSSRRGYGRRYY